MDGRPPSLDGAPTPAGGEELPPPPPPSSSAAEPPASPASPSSGGSPGGSPASPADAMVDVSANERTRVRETGDGVEPDDEFVDRTDLHADQPADATPEGHTRVTAFRWRSRIVRGLALVGLALFLYVGVSIFQVWSTGRADYRDPVDAIVVMGAAQYDGTPSPQLAARLDHVLELWPDNVAPLVVVTGGNLPGDRFTEAESSAAYLVERGIPESVILAEDRGSTTYESLEGVAALLAERGLDEVVIVTDPYHALRSKLTAKEVGLDAHVSSTDTSVVTGGSSLRRHLQEGAGVAVGRIIGFDRLEDLTD